MTNSADSLPAAARRRAGHVGAWRALTAVPAMAGSLLVLLMLFGWLGRWEGPVLAGWLVGGVALMTRVGERIGVRVGCGFRRPTAAQDASLAPLWSTALQRCGVAPGGVDLYVRQGAESNAYATGRRSIAVTSALLDDVQAHRLSDSQLTAVLAHEIGHHTGAATRFALVTTWLGSPWRTAARLTIVLGLTCAGRQPRRLLAAAVAAGVMAATVQAVQQRHWALALLIGSVALAAVVCPLADAAISRRGELTADEQAAAAGLGPQLAAALQVLDGRTVRRPGRPGRLLAHHPAVGRRAQLLRPLNGRPGRSAQRRSERGSVAASGRY